MRGFFSYKLKYKSKIKKAMNKDVFIKDKDGFYTVGFQTEKAKEVLSNQTDHIRMQAYGEELPKVDFLNVSINSIIRWCISHNLSIERK